MVIRVCGRGRRPGHRTSESERTLISEITNPRELLLHELGDILYVERALAEETLPKLIDEVRGVRTSNFGS